MQANNPIFMAILESDRIWGRQAPIDVIISLGTGKDNRGHKSVLHTKHRRSGYPALFRVARWMVSAAHEKLDPDIIHKIMSIVRKEEGLTYFRVDPEFEELPSMDDVNSMDFSQATVQCSLDVGLMSSIACSILSRAFYFELDTIPMLDARGYYPCRGTIRIRGHARDILAYLKNIYSGSISIAGDHQHSISAPMWVQGTVDLCPDCGRFRKPIQFQVVHMRQRISLSLRIGDAEFQISGFPNCMQWFVTQQNMTSPVWGNLDVHSFCLRCKNALRPQRRLSRLKLPRARRNAL